MPTPELLHLAGVLGSAFTLIGGVIWWFLRRHFNKVQREIKAIKEKYADVKEKEEGLRRQLQQSAKKLVAYQKALAELKGKQGVLEQQRDDARAESAVYKQRLERAEERAEDLEQQLHERVEKHQREVEARDEQIRLLGGERDRESDRAKQAETEAGQLTAHLEQLSKQVEQVIKQDERVWERPVAGTAFQPLSTREVPIIAVLNLKGGVGKTTITANLAGLMAQQGKKVLVIDADYQRSLSMLLVSDKDRKVLHLERRTLQHFLSNRSSLFYSASEVSDLPACWVMTNSDAQNATRPAGEPALEDIGLEDVEMRLMAEWMFREKAPDVRLRLREALHDQNLKEKGYQYVLIDCPPRLSTACINALAACDFFLVPVLLDPLSARSVPNLLRTLGRLRVSAFPHLNCLGVVANGVTVRNGKPIAREATTWKDLPVICRIAWGMDVHLFRAMVPDSGRIAEAAGRVVEQGEGSRLALDDTEIHGVFTALLKEIKTRIDHASKRLATVSA